MHLIAYITFSLEAALSKLRRVLNRVPSQTHDLSALKYLTRLGQYIHTHTKTHFQTHTHTYSYTHTDID